MNMTAAPQANATLGSGSCAANFGGRVIRPLASLPNRVGFVFVGLMRNGQIVRCHVVLDENKCHRVVGAKFSELQGWMEATQPFSGRAH